MILTLPNGKTVECRDKTYDELVFRESWFDDQYRMSTLPLPYNWALDLGANVGAWSTLAASAGAPVFAVECWRPNIEQMMQNLFRLELDNIATIEAAVVGHHVHEVYLDNIGDISQVGVQTHDDAADGRPMVDAIHINDLLSMHENWWCLKCDIEGGEFDVFAGVDKYMLNRVDYIVGEFHGGDMGQHVRWIGDKQYGDMMTTLAQWGNITTMGVPRLGGNFFGHRYGVAPPVVPAERVPIQVWLAGRS